MKGPQKLGTRGELLRRSETICSNGVVSGCVEDPRACAYLELVLVWELGAVLLRGPRTLART